MGYYRDGQYDRNKLLNGRAFSDLFLQDFINNEYNKSMKITFTIWPQNMKYSIYNF